ncbi:Ig-like domain-containing protein [Halococcoides cellulosivorans]|nr:Ig-like domain-containing protein [Halococcoides cellulosivorans]
MSPPTGRPSTTRRVAVVLVVLAVTATMAPIGVASANDPDQNDPPVTEPLDIRVEPGETVERALPVTDPDGELQTVYWVEKPSEGSLEIIQSNVSFRYTAPEDYEGYVTFEYAAQGDRGQIVHGTVTIHVTPNDPPQAINQSLAGLEDHPITGSFPAYDGNGDALNYTIETRPEEGTLGVDGHSFTYEPPVDWVGTAGFEYTVSDGSATDRGRIAITIRPVNDPPVATDQSISIDEDTNATVALNVTDPDDATHNYSITDAPALGRATIDNGTLTYVPDENAVGTDRVVYAVSDGQETTTAAVDVEITPVNDPPVARNVSTTVDEDASVTVSDLASDPDDTDLNYGVVNGPRVGSAGFSDGSLTYHAPDEFEGRVTVDYVVFDGEFAAQGRVTIDVQAVDDPPSVEDLALDTDEDTVVRAPIEVSDPDDTTFEYAIARQPQLGSATVTSGTLVYEPAPNVSGEDRLSVHVSDGTTVVVSSVTVSIAPVNDPPVAQNLSLDTDEDEAVSGTLSISDPDNSTFSIDVDEPANGSLTRSNRTITYTPDSNWAGTERVAYTASDGNATDQGWITVDVAPVNDPPVAENLSLGTDEDEAVSGTLSISDPDNSTFSIDVDEPANGSVDRSNRTITYTPDPNWAGTERVAYTASDGNATDQGWITVDVAPVNDPPVAENLSLGTDEDEAVSGTLSISDPDNSTFSIDVDEPANGSLTRSNRTITYTPDSNWAGTERVAYTASDGNATDQGWITVDVAPVNDPPVAENLSLGTDEDEAVSGTLSISDPDNSTFSIDVDEPANGSVERSNHTITYTPDPNWSGTERVAYTASDGNATDRGWITIEVSPVNDPPVAENLTLSALTGETVEHALPVSDVDDRTLDITVQNATNASVENRTLVYEATTAGVDRFTYVVDDGAATARGTVTVTVTASNRPPTATNQSIDTVGTDRVRVALNASDPDGDALNYTIDAVSNGSAAVSNDTLLFDPVAVDRTAIVTYTVSDGTYSASAVVRIAVHENQPPTADNATLSVTEGGTASTDLDARDPDGGDLAFAVGTGPANGSAELNATTGVLTYTPDPGFVGRDTVVVRVSDGHVNTTARVSITVAAASTPGESGGGSGGFGLPSRDIDIETTTPTPAGGAVRTPVERTTTPTATQTTTQTTSRETAATPAVRQRPVDGSGPGFGAIAALLAICAVGGVLARQ